jgi:pilus assembly protein CpaC
VTPEIVQPIPAGAPLPQVKTTDKFLSSDSTVLTNAQSAEAAGAKPATPPPATMPVEKLVDSMKPEEPLVIEGGMSAGAGGTTSSGQSGTSSSTSTAPTQ